ncbi:hypothetical protein MASR2M48_19170 [Spirochaetota bacterium]
MGYDYIGFKGILSQEYRGTLGRIEEAGAMKAIAPYHMLFIPLVWQGIGVAGAGHGLVPGGVHDCAMWYVWKNGLGSLNAGYIGGVMQGSQVYEILEGGQDSSVMSTERANFMPP